jgi:hypothetical protein
MHVDHIVSGKQGAAFAGSMTGDISKKQQRKH